MRTLLSSLILLVLVAAACSDSDDSNGAADDSTSVPSSTEPESDPEADEATAESSTTTSTIVATSSTSTSTTTSTTSTVVVPPDPETTGTTPVTTLPATVGIPDPEDEVVNEGGVPITLDETAALACANAEFARDSLSFENLDQAERDLNAAADRAEPSEQPDIAEAADLIRGALGAADPIVVVETFLDICIEHGHQI